MIEVLIDVVLIIWAAALGYIDWRSKKLPNFLTLPALLIVLLIAACQQNWLAIAGGIAWFLLYLAVGVLSLGVGGGDIKLAPTLGILVGAGGLVPVLFAIGLAQIFSIGISLIMREKRIPHGPAMLLATAIIWILVPSARLI